MMKYNIKLTYDTPIRKMIKKYIKELKNII